MDAPVILVPAIFDIGSGAHWIIILVVALLLFGRRLPEIMKGLGGSIREFKKGMDTDAKPDPTPDGAISRQAEPPPHVTPPVPPVGHSEHATSAPVEPPKSP
jgi:TatA/E family protein of Tat protein translocase